ncbi:MAG: L-arabinose isomerase [Propionibacteriaceae bacterium]|jgi:L-arabinose isomerase|nr:L-arabinose isomerase [Propionibacteriaceae bacterium]
MSLATASPKPAVWFLTGSQDLYGDAVLAQVADNSRRIAAVLSDPAGLAEIVWKPVLTSKDAIRRTILEANADDDCLGLICWMHTFSPAKMWIAGLDALAKPLLHLHTQVDVELPWASIDMDFMNLNQAAHGDREFAYLETRLAVPRSTVVGHVSDPRTAAEVDVWIRAAAGRQELRRLTVVRFGDNMRNVAVTEGDKVEAEHVFGPAVLSFGVTELAAATEAVPAAAAAALAADYEDRYEVAGELRRGGARHGSLLYAAQQELALRGFLAEHGAWAFTTNFEDLGGLRQLPGLAVQRLMADGYGFGAEGDWKTAVLVRAAKAMGAGRPGGASLMEDYTYHLVPGRERILGAHMLEVCPSLTTKTPRLEIHPLGIGGREDPVRLVFDADPGPGLLVGLADLRDRFRLTANEVELVAPDQPMPCLPVGRAVWAPAPDFRTSAACWLTAGGPHHTVLTTATDAAIWTALAAQTGTELALIDKATTRAAFEKELRWNAAYHRLARGL